MIALSTQQFPLGAFASSATRRVLRIACFFFYLSLSLPSPVDKGGVLFADAAAVDVERADDDDDGDRAGRGALSSGGAR